MENSPTVENLFCPACQFKTQSDWFFCPNCAHELKEKPPVISVFKQILIYSVSFFLTPLGLGWGLKYARYKDTKTKIVGIISIVLTVLSLVLISLVAKNFIDQYAQILNNIIPSY
jgi:putative Mn2+ efflux pump MntP